MSIARDPERTRGTHRTRRGPAARPLRITFGYGAGLAAVAAPYLLYWALAWRPFSGVGAGAGAGPLALGVAPLFLGAFVTALCARPRPLWLDGGLLGFIISLAVAIFFVSGTGDWGGVPTVLLLAAFGGIIGLGGGAFGTLVVRPLLAEQAWPKP